MRFLAEIGILSHLQIRLHGAKMERTIVHRLTDDMGRGSLYESDNRTF
jgi:hypothetical protein